MSRFIEQFTYRFPGNLKYRTQQETFGNFILQKNGSIDSNGGGMV
jgi:hypothetical protein